MRGPAWGAWLCCLCSRLSMQLRCNVCRPLNVPGLWRSGAAPAELGRQQADWRAEAVITSSDQCGPTIAESASHRHDRRGPLPDKRPGSAAAGRGGPDAFPEAIASRTAQLRPGGCPGPPGRNARRGVTGAVSPLPRSSRGCGPADKVFLDARAPEIALPCVQRAAQSWGGKSSRPRVAVR